MKDMTPDAVAGLTPERKAYMHDVPSGFSGLAQRQAALRPGRGLEFLWLELTNRCNLHCVHCYSDSHPRSGERDVMTAADYRSVMRQAFDLGCRNIQFIGGEPQLNADFHSLLVDAKAIGFGFIEVFTNLTRLNEQTVRFAADNDICFATSVYSDDAETHDAITKVRSSHQRTMSNLARLIDDGITTRAGIIVMDQNRHDADRTEQALRDMGVGHVRQAETQPFGRGEQLLDREAAMSGLCGHCWNGKLCVAPDGDAYPCVMARHWPVGNVLRQPLSEIMAGPALETIRQDIYAEVWLPKLAVEKKPAKKKKKDKKPHKKTPVNCVPEKACIPNETKHCGPGKLPDYDKGKGKTTNGPKDECLQSCIPTNKTECHPAVCAVSCEPGEIKKKPR